jgi:hypothetical protein
LPALQQVRGSFEGQFGSRASSVTTVTTPSAMASGTASAKVFPCVYTTAQAAAGNAMRSARTERRIIVNTVVGIPSFPSDGHFFWVRLSFSISHLFKAETGTGFLLTNFLFVLHTLRDVRLTVRAVHYTWKGTPLGCFPHRQAQAGEK